MKKLVLFFAVSTVALCLGILCSCGQDTPNYNLTYVYQEGGYIYGDTNQTVEKGADGIIVMAVANDGYRFLGWSDGVKTAQRLDKNVEEDKTVTALFEEIEYINISYIAEDGGSVYGELFQTIEKGEGCTQVYAVADTGYRFLGWSDGVKTAQRLDKDIEEDKTVTAQFEKIEYVKVKYIAEDGGSVYGELSQTIEKNNDCTQVYAAAEAGYRFLGWSDGVKTAQRFDTDVEESKTVTAQFEKIEYVKVKYIAEDGGSVYGELSQTIEKNNDCTQVYAAAEAGYRFAGWSDGVKTAQRFDTDVEESKTVTARFEQITVLFYSDDLLVRKYTLNEFKTIDVSKIVGYASFKEFANWEFIGVYVGYNSDDPLNLIKTYFSDMSDLPDIQLEAVYTEMTGDESIPFKSKTIAHALGGVNNKAYLNSKEAFETSYNYGARFFEADIALTTDEYIVLDHNRGEYSYESFMNMASDGYTPLSLQNLLDYMTIYPEIWVDIDTLGFTNAQVEIFIASFKELIVNYDIELLDRLIFETASWNKSLIDLLKNEIGISNLLYTEDWYTNDLEVFEQTCIFCEENGIKFVSIPWNWMLNKGEEKVQLLKQYGIYIMAYTTSDIETMYRLYDIGVDCIFTDFSLI